MPAIRFLLLTAAAFLGLSLLAGVDGFAPGAVQLQTELKVSGPVVYIRAPLGFRYRPGIVFPLQVQVFNPGTEFNGELIVSEGDPDSGPRYGPVGNVNFAAQTTRIFSFPVRAPSVSANLFVVIRESGSSVGPLRFKATLASVLKPLSSEGQIILSLGVASALPLPHLGAHDLVQLSPRDFPDEAWMYESVDTVILSDSSLKEISPAAHKGLRSWLLSGGRLLIASNDALQAAIQGRLLPFDPEKVPVVGSDRAWWEQHAGLSDSDVLAQKNNRPVYIRLKQGFGQIISLFPATNLEDATQFGAEIVNNPALRRMRAKLPDFRVQPQRYDGFAGGAASASRRGDAIHWIALGALVFCAGLAFAFTSRSRLVALGWPLVVTALLSVLLAHWFSPPELTLSRIELIQSCATADIHEEWTLLESFHDPLEVAAASPAGGVIAPLYGEPSEIKSSSVRMLAGTPENVPSTLRLEKILVAPNQPALIYAAATLEHSAQEMATLHAGKLALAYANPDPKFPMKAALLLRTHQEPEVLTKWSQDSAELSPLGDLDSVVRETLNLKDDNQIKAHVAALRWAMNNASQNDGDHLVFFADSADGSSLAAIDREAESGSRFVVRIVPANVVKP